MTIDPSIPGVSSRIERIPTPVAPHLAGYICGEKLLIPLLDGSYVCCPNCGSELVPEIISGIARDPSGWCRIEYRSGELSIRSRRLSCQCGTYITETERL